jgi:hypothetical protein
MSNFQFGTLLIFTLAMHICISKLIKKIAKGDSNKKVSIEYVWVVVPGALAAFCIFLLFIYNNWFIGSVIPAEFIENQKHYFWIRILAAALGAYRLIVGVNRYRKAKHDDTVFGYEDRSVAKIIVVSGVILLMTAWLIYIIADIVVPFIWRLKMR